MQRNKDELIAQLRNRISQLEEECDRSNINLFNQTTVLQEINQLQKLQEMDHSKLCLKLN